MSVASHHAPETAVVTTGVAAFPAAAHITFGFDPGEVCIEYKGDGLGEVQYSFDGAVVHGRVDNANKKIMLEQPSERKMWFRELTAGTTLTKVLVTASTVRR